MTDVYDSYHIAVGKVLVHFSPVPRLQALVTHLHRLRIIFCTKD